MVKLIVLTNTACNSGRKVQIPAQMHVETIAGYPTLIRTLEKGLTAGLKMILDHRGGEPCLWVGKCPPSGHLLLSSSLEVIPPGIGPDPQ